jgi:hypothetical protein
MQTGVQFHVIYQDDDLIQLRVSAWNGEFGGLAEIYAGIGALAEAAAKLRGFPNKPSDTREVIFGNFDRKFAGGGLSMRFHCIDGAGHSYVEASIDSNCSAGGTVQTAVLAMRVEATAVDIFVQELQRVEATRTGTALLRGLAGVEP